MLISAFNESVSVMDKKLPWIVCFSAALFFFYEFIFNLSYHFRILNSIIFDPIVIRSPFLMGR